MLEPRIGDLYDITGGGPGGIVVARVVALPDDALCFAWQWAGGIAAAPLDHFPDAVYLLGGAHWETESDALTARNRLLAQAIEVGALATLNQRRTDAGLHPRESLESLESVHSRSTWRADAEAAIRAAEPLLREVIANEIEGLYLGPDSGRLHDGSEPPDAHLRQAYDEGIEAAAHRVRCPHPKCPGGSLCCCRGES